MSEFHSVEIDIDDESCLVEALKELGYKPQIHKQATNLFGYQGDRRKQVANIVIPRSQVGSASNDVGFEKVNGKYVMHLSEYDKSAKTFNVNKMKQFYAKNKVQKFVKSNVGKYSLKKISNEKDGSIKIRLNRN